MDDKILTKDEFDMEIISAGGSYRDRALHEHDDALRDLVRRLRQVKDAAVFLANKVHEGSSATDYALDRFENVLERNFGRVK